MRKHKKAFLFAEFDNGEQSGDTLNTTNPLYGGKDHE